MRNPIMGEDDIVELIWKSGQIVSSSQTQTDPPILHGSGSSSGGGGENAPVPPPPPPPQHHHIFIHEDEMASWLNPRHQENDFYSDLLYSGVVAASQPQISISLAPPPASQIIAARRVENFTNFARLRGNLITGAGPLIPVLRESTQVDSSGTPSSSAAVSCLTPATQGIGGVSHTFAVPGLSRKAKEVAIETICEIAGTSSSVGCKAETEPIHIRPTTETEIAGEEDRKRKEREETEETEEALASTSSRKRSRAAEMHNLSERRRRGKINDRMKALQELIPCCKKSDRASMLDDAIELMKSLQMQVQMISTGNSMVPPPNMQPHMAMGMDLFLVRLIGPSYPPPHYPFPAYDPSRIPPTQQPNPVWNHHPQFPGYMNPYSQFAGLQQQQMQQPPPPLQNQTTSQPSLDQASGSREHEDQENQPSGE